jgi:hypothetical protein
LIKILGDSALDILEGVLAVAVVGLAVWLMFGSSPTSRSPRVEQQERFTNNDDTDLRDASANRN